MPSRKHFVPEVGGVLYVPTAPSFENPCYASMPHIDCWVFLRKQTSGENFWSHRFWRDQKSARNDNGLSGGLELSSYSLESVSGESKTHFWTNAWPWSLLYQCRFLSAEPGHEKRNHKYIYALNSVHCAMFAPYPLVLDCLVHCQCNISEHLCCD